MGVLFSIMGITLSLIAAITLIKRTILTKYFVVKKARVIGFEAYTYSTPGMEYSTIYNAKIYPIIQVDDNNKLVKIAISSFGTKNNLQYGDEIEVIYPKGKLEKVKIYCKDNIYNFYYLTLIIGLLITILSIAII